MWSGVTSRSVRVPGSSARLHESGPQRSDAFQDALGECLECSRRGIGRFVRDWDQPVSNTEKYKEAESMKLGGEERQDGLTCVVSKQRTSEKPSLLILTVGDST